MRGHIVRVLAAALLALAATAFAACGKDTASGGGGSGSGGVKTGPGVTDKKITVGAMTDLTGVFGVLGKAITQGNQLFWEQQNAAGGVCGRKVDVLVKDHGYDVQTGVSQYREIEPKVAALQQLVGSPIAAALLPSLERDKTVAVLAAWPPSLLPSQQIAILGASYDLEAINGIDWMMKNKGLKSGGKLGVLYFEGDYGEGGLVGVKSAAKENDLELVEQKIKATDQDMSGAVSAFRRADVDAIWLTVAPRQTASLAGLAKAQGLDVPIGGNGPIFSPTLLKTAAGKALEENVNVFASTAPFSAEPASEAAQAFKEKYPKELPQVGATTGWAEAEVLKQVLQKACDDKDLSREGITKAFRSLSSVDTQGLIAGTLDFSKVGQSSGREVYVTSVDRNEEGGLRVEGDGPYLSEAAKSYTLQGE